MPSTVELNLSRSVRNDEREFIRLIGSAWPIVDVIFAKGSENVFILSIALLAASRSVSTVPVSTFSCFCAESRTEVSEGTSLAEGSIT